MVDAIPSMFGGTVTLVLRDKRTRRTVVLEQESMLIEVETHHGKAPSFWEDGPILGHTITVEADFLDAFTRQQAQLEERRQIARPCGAPGYRDGWTCEKGVGHDGNHGVRAPDDDWYDWPREA